MPQENYAIARTLRKKNEQPVNPSDKRAPWAAPHPCRQSGRTNKNNTGG